MHTLLIHQKINLIKWSIYLINVIIFLIFGLSMPHPQWLILAIPFMVMSAMINKHFNTFMMMDILLMLVFTIFTVLWTPYVNHNLLEYGIFKNIPGEGFGSVVIIQSIFMIKDKNLMFFIMSGLFFS